MTTIEYVMAIAFAVFLVGYLLLGVTVFYREWRASRARDARLAAEDRYWDERIRNLENEDDPQDPTGVPPR